MFDFPTLPEEDFNEDNLITKDFLTKATNYLNEKGIYEISVYGKKRNSVTKSRQKEKIFTVKQFFVKLANTAGLYGVINDNKLQNDVGFALLCLEQQPRSYLDLPETIAKHPQICEYCNRLLINHDPTNALNVNFENFSAEQKHELLKIKFLIISNSEKFATSKTQIMEICNNYKFNQTDFVKELLKANPNIFQYVKNYLNDDKSKAEIHEFINNLPLEHGTISLGRIFKTPVNPKYKEQYPKLFKKYEFYLKNGFYVKDSYYDNER